MIKDYLEDQNENWVKIKMVTKILTVEWRRLGDKIRFYTLEFKGVNRLYDMS